MKTDLRKRFGWVIGGTSVAVIVALSPHAVFAKPLHAALTDRGLGCFVTDANQNITPDASCTWHLTVKRDALGNIVFYSYQDQGQLPADGARPAGKSQKTVFSQSFYDPELQTIIECAGYEIITSSGQYKSNCKSE